MTLTIQQQVDLKPFNTMSLNCVANYYCLVRSDNDIKDAVKFAQKKNLPIWVLGSGSNVIFAQDYAGVVLHIATKGIEVVSDTSDVCIVKVAAGENWDEFLQYCLQHNYYGLENLAIIPGTVGATPIQNVGAYGQEVADCICAVHALNIADLTETIFTHEQCEFSYRESIFKNSAKDHYIITYVEFRLQKVFKANVSYQALNEFLHSSNPSADDVRNAVIHIRQQKLPSPNVIANTGSFFKNPVIDAAHLASLKNRFPSMPSFQQDENHFKLAAGWLIEKAGWKGKNLGAVGMYEKQALVLVNHGGATFADIQRLVAAVKQSVFDEFGVVLEQEPILVN